ncbi:MAG: LuxR family transcriptional regulator [Devosia sp.]
MQFDDDVFDTIERLNAAPDDGEILGLLRQFSLSVGYEHFIVSGLPPRGVNVEPFVLAADWPAEWYERYFSRDYTQFDPVARHCFHTTTPFLWNEAPFEADDAYALQVMNEASDCRLSDGFCVPVHTEDGSQGCVSFGGTEKSLDPNKKLATHLVAMYAHGRLRALRRPYQFSPAELTPREAEVLRWLSHGKTTEDIGELLGISQNTVFFHIKSAGKKLGTLNRVHLVAEALRYNMIAL